MKGFRYGFGFVPNFKNLLLGGAPVFPTAGNVGYYSVEDPSNLGFSSGVLVNSLLDQSSAGNDLSQGTASANPTYIEDLAKPWLSRLSFDGVDDHLEGMAVQTGDFTYIFKGAFNTLSTFEFIFSHTTGTSALFLGGDNYLYLRDITNANDILLTGHTVESGDHVYAITREGNSLKYYVDSCLKGTFDVTGRTFELDTFGSPSFSLADLTAEWGVWDRALTQNEVNYFSYLRSAETNDILIPPLTPDCIIPTGNALPSNLPTIL